MDPVLPALLQKALEAGPWPFIAVVTVLLLKRDVLAFFIPKAITPELVAPLLMPVTVLLTHIVDRQDELIDIQTKIYERILLDGRHRGA